MGPLVPGPPLSIIYGTRNGRSLPLKPPPPPYLMTATISEPPFRGLFAGLFFALQIPLLNPEHCSMYPLSQVSSHSNPLSQDRHPTPPPPSSQVSCHYNTLGEICLCSKWDLRTQCSHEKKKKLQSFNFCYFP